MPEMGVLFFFYLEMCYVLHKLGHIMRGKKKRTVPYKDTAEWGTLIFHPECCADSRGAHASVHLHQPSLDHPLLYPLPRIGVLSHLNATTEPCQKCTPPSYNGIPTDEREELVRDAQAILQGYDNTSLLSNLQRAEDIMNCLKIRGYGDAYYAIRISFATEGHVFGIPTEQYDTIVAAGTVPRGQKSRTFKVPVEFTDGGLNDNPCVSILAAFRRPEWTLLFVDHQVFLKFHVMRLRRPLTEENFKPGTAIWDCLWSAAHGPVYTQEPEATEAALENWRASVMKRPFSSSTILEDMKSAQHACNGLGTQEATDVCMRALISPAMPTSDALSSPVVWPRLRRAITTHAAKMEEFVRSRYSNGLPHVSNDRAFSYKPWAHETYLQVVECYRRDFFRAESAFLAEAISLGLTNERAVCDRNGVAHYSSDTAPMSPDFEECPTEVARNCATTYLPIYVYWVNKKPHYSPWIFRWPDHWMQPTQIARPEIDIKQIFFESTLGPYSFNAFCSNAHAIRESDKKRTVEARRGPPKFIKQDGFRDEVSNA
ncbi:hypothetical protein EV121DRAFT_295012 [Schizophyllum commune]